MADINRVAIEGKALDNPQLSKTQAGVSMVKFHLGHATVKNTVETTEVFEITAFESSPVFGQIYKHVKAGRKMVITGKLNSREYLNQKTGMKGYNIGFIANGIILDDPVVPEFNTGKPVVNEAEDLPF